MAAEHGDLAETLCQVTVRYHNLWRMSFPYMMVVHQAPTDGRLQWCVPCAPAVSPAVAQAEPTQLPQRPRGRRRQLFQRHHPDEKAAELGAQPIVDYMRDPHRAS